MLMERERKIQWLKMLESVVGKKCRFEMIA